MIESMEIQGNAIFGYNDYKVYLKTHLGKDGQRTGQRKALAEHLGIQTAFVSQVLKSHSQFSLEHGCAINVFLHHNKVESKFLLLLIQRERAGTEDLRRFFDDQVEQERLVHQQIKSRVKKNVAISPEQQSTYYSQWIYLAVHMALSVPKLQSPRELATHFNLALEETHEILLFLQEANLIYESGGRYSIGDHHMHIGESNINIRNHHTNWRLRTINELTKDYKEKLQYSVVYSLSKKDARRLKENFLELIKDNLSVIKDSKEEELYCNTIDFFRI